MASFALSARDGTEEGVALGGVAALLTGAVKAPAFPRIFYK